MGYHTNHNAEAFSREQLCRRTQDWVRQQHPSEDHVSPQAPQLATISPRPATVKARKAVSVDFSDQALQVCTVSKTIDDDSSLTLLDVPPLIDDEHASSNTLPSPRDHKVPKPSTSRFESVSQLRDRIRFENTARKLCEASPELAAQDFKYAIQLAKQQHFESLKSINQNHKRTMREFQEVQLAADYGKKQRAAWVRKRGQAAIVKGDEDKTDRGKISSADSQPVDALTLAFSTSKRFFNKRYPEDGVQYHSGSEDFMDLDESDSDESDDEDVDTDNSHTSTSVTQIAGL